MFQAVSSLSRQEKHRRSNSFSSDDSSPSMPGGELPPAILVYHESARSIVFRDHIRRAAIKGGGGHLHNQRQGSDLAGVVSRASTVSEESVAISNFEPVIAPLPMLELGPQDEFEPLKKNVILDSENTAETTAMTLNTAEQEVVTMLKEQRAVVKTLKNADWKDFLSRFLTPVDMKRRYASTHSDIGKHDEYPFNSFVTSTSLLPRYGEKMRAYGSMNEYTTGVVFALPNHFGTETEEEAVKRTETWAWPSGYSAKTEYNIDSRGRLINGREEALVSLSTLRRQNHDYVTKEDYYLAGRFIKGGLKQVPYNEVYVRVGGIGRIVEGVDCATGVECSDEDGTGRSLDTGVGLPVALFVRTSSYGHLISMLRTKARMSTVVGSEHIRDIPLLFMAPDVGLSVLTEELQTQLLKIVAHSLNPFQNPSLAYKTTIDDTSEEALKQKTQELLDLNHDQMHGKLTPEELARLAGGFGSTDESVATLLMTAKKQDREVEQGLAMDHDHHLQDLVNEGLAAAVRSGDYHTSRQMLILYSLVASTGNESEERDEKGEDSDGLPRFEQDESIVKRQAGSGELERHKIPRMPPPPPLDTDRLRSATNSDGLLAVLGAAQVLKAMKDGSAARRAQEAVDSIEEWVEHGEQSMAFRLASWRDQRAAQGDLKIATRTDSNFMAFVSNKAISNRKAFATQLREAISKTDFESVFFLKVIHELVSRMHSPCLRLELLQYVLGLDNRYSVAHVARSVELAATCMSMSVTAVSQVGDPGRTSASPPPSTSKEASIS